jgi:hypothetical protein
LPTGPKTTLQNKGKPGQGFSPPGKKRKEKKRKKKEERDGGGVRVLSARDVVLFMGGVGLGWGEAEENLTSCLPLPTPPLVYLCFSSISAV